MADSVARAVELRDGDAVVDWRVAAATVMRAKSERVGVVGVRANKRSSITTDDGDVVALAQPSAERTGSF
jgi:hypothetical protein